ncbi:MAG TPA: PQQ-dependent sugar dehydrogenase, partial [Treponemataceae bacterium]|nr:PQQ-dependent sugar dehydrogenase [Treponemataceae bacterium]
RHTMKKVFSILIFLAALNALSAQSSLPVTEDTVIGQFETAAGRAILRRMVSGLQNPWSFDFLPTGEILITERGGTLVLIDDKQTHAITGLPPISAGGQGGLLDILVDPDFEKSRTVYFTYATAGSGGRGTTAARAQLDGYRLSDVRVLWEMKRKTGTGHHFGSRIRMLTDSTLLISTGDRGDMKRAQDMADAAGKTHRINADGTIPLDNPFRTVRGALPSLYTTGHRNIQGLAVHPATGEIWASEHGPQGGDEINIIESGKNYGWPIVTYGRNYGTGTRIGEGETKEGMQNPVIQWTPSIAPSGLTFYTGDAFPLWKGSLFSGNLAGQRVVRLIMENSRVTGQEIVLQGTVGRIRDVREGPDGFLYLITDSANGALYRIEPAP